MSSVIIYLDESGDLGWSFGSLYRHGGSSRYLTISAVVLPKAKSHYVTRLIKSLYDDFNWNIKKEKKWSSMKDDHRMHFANKIKDLCIRNNEIKLFSITTYKPRVQEHIRKDPNTLYNYMIYTMLANEISLYNEVIFVPDPRSVKVESGNSLHDYLCTQLYFEKKATTRLQTCPRDSSSHKGVQFADMLSGIVQQHFEDRKSAPFKEISKIVSLRTLFFNPSEDFSSLEEIEVFLNDAHMVEEFIG